MSKTIHVIKRDGSKEILDITKIQTQISRACENIQDVSESMIEIKASIQFEDGMTTETIDKLLLRAMVDLIDVDSSPEEGNTNYQFVAGKQRIRMLRKQVYGTNSPPKLIDIVKDNIERGFYTDQLLEWYSDDEWETMNNMIDHNRDDSLSYSAAEQLIEKYLVQDRTSKTPFETPQIRYIIAAATAFHAETDKRLSKVKNYYDSASKGHFTLATPVLAGLGTPTKQFSSCVLITAGDSLKSIFATGEMMANYAAKRAGLGLEIGKLRSIGSPIRGGEIMHTGIVPFLKKWFGDLRCASQGGIRNSSCSVFLPVWHMQFLDFIVLKNNQGTEENRIRHMDYGVVLSKLFLKRLKDKGIITFFDPNDLPDLYEAYYSDVELFEKLYVKYEKDASVRKSQISAEELFRDYIIKERTDTGRIYIMFVDNVINHTPFDSKTHPIYQSNLCLTGDTMVDIIENGIEKTVPVSEVYPYDNEILIKSKHINSDDVVYSAVTAAGITGYKAKLLKITDMDSGKSIKCTPEHLIFTRNRGWVEAKNLKENDKLDVYNKSVSKTSSSLLIEDVTALEDVYDLTVSNVHNFYANDILVHNCLEILLPNKPFERLDDETGRIALCTLGSINWGSFRNPEDMKDACKTLVRSLSNLLNYQDFLSIQSKLSNEEFEPLGIGVTNLAYWHAKRGLRYGTPEALAEVKRWMEHQAYYLTEASVELAEEKGPCKLSHTTSYGKGIFPWEKRVEGTKELTDFTPELDWEPLRTRMIKSGTKNAVLMAIAPVESCQSKNNLMLLANDETISLGDLLSQAGIDVELIETENSQRWIDLPNTINIKGRNGDETVSKVWFNGRANTKKITFEDGSVYEFTDNHRLLVNRDDKECWIKVIDLVPGDDIVSIGKL